MNKKGTRMSLQRFIKTGMPVAVALLFIGGRGIGTDTPPKPSAKSSLPLAGADPSPFAVKTEEKVAVFRPEVRDDGIFYGDKGLVVDANGGMRIITGNQETANCFYYVNTKGSPYITVSSPGTFGAKEFKKDIPKGVFEFSGRFLLEKDAPLEGVYQHKVELLADGKIRVDISWSTPVGKEKEINRGSFFMSIPESKAIGGKLLVDAGATTNEEIIIPDKEKWGYFYKTQTRKIQVFPDQPSLSFAVEPQVCDYTQGAVRNSQHDSIIILKAGPEGKRISFLLDLGTGPSANDNARKQAGIDFRRLDDLVMPDTGSTKNLLPNPSFESGFESYQNSFGFCQYRTEVERDPGFWHDKPFAIDDKEAMFGNRSMMLLARRPAIKGDYRHIGYPFRTFPIPLSPGKYTFSFYAKGQPGEKQCVSLWIPNAAWTGNVYLPIGYGKGTTGAQKVFEISQEWKRYSLSFEVPQSMPVIASIGAGSESGKSHVWIDALQLEAGGQVTDFEPRPVEARLLTSAEDNFLEAGTPLNARLEINSKPAATGKVKVSVTNFFGEEVYDDEFRFDCDKSGKTQIALPLDGKIQRGIFMLKADFELPGGVRTYDLMRFTVMDFLKNEHRLKGIFAEEYGAPESRNDFLKLLARYRKIGFGAKNHLHNFDKPVYDAYRSCGVKVTDTFMLSPFYMLVDGRDKMVGFCLKDPPLSYRLTVDSPGITIRDFNLDAKGEMTDEYLTAFQAAVARIAKSYPWIDTWAPHCEMFAKFPYSWWSKDGSYESAIKNYAKFSKAFYLGVKEGNPNAKVFPDSPCNMSPEGGIRDIGNVLAETNRLGGVKFEMLAAHTYRETPENPDLDADTQLLLKTLDENGYKDTPVLWGEGMHFGPYNIPQWGIKSGSWMPPVCWVYGPLSYGMGWTEKISAAWRARCWLVALKYQDRVISSMSGAVNNSEMDLNMTPFATQKIPNTLGRLLGDAHFKKDVRFAPYVRCYIFEDAEKRPVAAVWCSHPKADAGVMKAPEASANFGGSLEQLFDLMECERGFNSDADGNVTFPVSPFPMFFRGKPMMLDAFVKAFDNASMISGDGISPLMVSSKLSAPDECMISAKNYISKVFDSTLICSSQNVPLKVPASGVSSVHLKLPINLCADKIVPENLPLTIKSEKSAFATDVSFDGFVCRKATSPITVDGNLDDWKDIPAIKLTNRLIRQKDVKSVSDADFSGWFKTAWTPQGLYLCVAITDDKFVHKEFKDPGANWSNDSLQVYFDTFCDARAHQQYGYDENDYDYLIFPEAGGEDSKVYRSRSPDPQLGLATQAPPDKALAPEIQSAFKLTEDGYVYELFFPAKYLLPMRLEKGYSVGFGLLANDRDNESDAQPKSSLTVTPPNTECWNKPHLWAAMLLWD